MLEKETKDYIDSIMAKNMDELRNYKQQSAHMIDTVAPLKTLGVDGHLRLYNGATKKIYVKMNSQWYSTTVS